MSNSKNLPTKIVLCLLVTIVFAGVASAGDHDQLNWAVDDPNCQITAPNDRYYSQYNSDWSFTSTGDYGGYVINKPSCMKEGNLLFDYDPLGNVLFGNECTFTQTGGHLWIGYADITGVYYLTGGELWMEEAFLSGLFVQSGGTYSSELAITGGTYVLDGGRTHFFEPLWITNNGIFICNNGIAYGDIDVGMYGNGTMIQTGGSIKAGLELGSAYGDGFYFMSGGTLGYHNNYYDNCIVGKSGGYGTFAQNESNGNSYVSMYNLYLGKDSESTGIYTLSAGTLEIAGTEKIGSEGRGTFIQSGGTHLAGGLYIGYNAGSTGYYELSGGTLSSGLCVSQNDAKGSFNWAGGVLDTHSVTVNVGGDIAVTPSTWLLNGDLTINDGNLHGPVDFKFNGSGNMYAGFFQSTNIYLGTINDYFEYNPDTSLTQYGGSISLDPNVGYMYVGEGASATGSYHRQGGTITAFSMTVGTDGGIGTFSQSDGLSLFNGPIIVGSGSGATGNYTLSGGSTNCSYQVVGGSSASYGMATVSNSSILESREYITVGDGQGSWGKYDILSSAVVSTPEFMVANSGAGEVVVYGGTLTTDNIHAGDEGLGYIYAGKGGSDERGIISSGNIYVGNEGWGNIVANDGGMILANNIYAGNAGDANIVVNNGGSLSATYLYLGTYSTGTGRCTLNYGGTLNVQDLYLAGAGRGTFTNYGSTFSCPGVLQMSSASTSDSLFEMSGELIETNALYVGGEGSATFNHNSGLHNNSGTVSIGSKGIYNLKTGTFNFSGSTFSALGTLKMNTDYGSNTVFTMSGQLMESNMLYIEGEEAPASFNHDSGLHTNSGTINIGTKGIYNLNGGSLIGNHMNIAVYEWWPSLGGSFALHDGLLNVPVISGGGHVVQDGGRAIVEDVTGNYDLNSGQLEVGGLNTAGTVHVHGNYSQTGSGKLMMDINSLTSMDVLAIDGNDGNCSLGGTLDLHSYRPHEHETFTMITWTGSEDGNFAGITTNITLGQYGSEPFFSGYVDSNTYVVKFHGLTGGDAQGDHKVSGGDMAILGANWGGPGRTWSQGDFNGDGYVSGGDLGILGTNWGWVCPNPPPPVNIPEPAAMFTMAVYVCVSLIRRRVVKQT